MKYTFHHYSRLHYALLFLLPILLSFPVILVSLSWEESDRIITLIIAIVVVGALAVYLPRKLTRSTIEATLENDLLILDWIKPAWGTQVKTIHIYFKDLISYKYEYSRNLHLFKLTLSDGSVIKINREFEDDDFDIFYHNFEEMVGSYRRIQNIQPILLEKSLNEKLSFLIPMTILFGLGLVGGIYLTFFKSEYDSKKIFLIIISAVLFIIFLTRTIIIIRRRSTGSELVPGNRHFTGPAN